MWPHRFPCEERKMRSVRLRQDEDHEKIQLADEELSQIEETAKSEAEGRQVQEGQKEEEIKNLF